MVRSQPEELRPTCANCHHFVKYETIDKGFQVDWEERTGSPR